jgi:ribosome-binding factor A
MTSRRTAKLAQAILESVSSAVLFGLKDPRVKNVTVMRVEPSPDLRSAKVYVSIMGDERAQSLCMHGLRSARGFLQAKVADRLKTRYTPTLNFVVDSGVKQSLAATEIIRDVLGESQRDETEFTRTPLEPPASAGLSEELPTSGEDDSSEQSEATSVTKSP